VKISLNNAYMGIGFGKIAKSYWKINSFEEKIVVLYLLTINQNNKK